MSANDRSDAVSTVCLAAMQTFLHDGTWTTLGFPSRPNHGAFFDRFRPAWRVRLEERAGVEILSLIGAIYVHGRMIAASEIPLVVDGMAEAAVGTLGVSSADEARGILERRMLAYATASLPEWPQLLVAGLAFEQIPDRVLWASLMVGVVQVPASLEPLVQRLQSKYSVGPA